MSRGTRPQRLRRHREPASGRSAAQDLEAGEFDSAAAARRPARPAGEILAPQRLAAATAGSSACRDSRGGLAEISTRALSPSARGTHCRQPTPDLPRTLKVVGDREDRPSAADGNNRRKHVDQARGRSRADGAAQIGGDTVQPRIGPAIGRAEALPDRHARWSTTRWQHWPTRGINDADGGGPVRDPLPG
jgi:hypothetical protein